MSRRATEDRRRPERPPWGESATGAARLRRLAGGAGDPGGHDLDDFGHDDAGDPGQHDPGHDDGWDDHAEPGTGYDDVADQPVVDVTDGHGLGPVGADP